MPDNRLGGLAGFLPDPLPQLLTELSPPARTDGWRNVPDGVHDAPKLVWPIESLRRSLEVVGTPSGAEVPAPRAVFGRIRLHAHYGAQLAAYCRSRFTIGCMVRREGGCMPQPITS